MTTVVLFFCGVLVWWRNERGEAGYRLLDSDLLWLTTPSDYAIVFLVREFGIPVVDVERWARHFYTIDLSDLRQLNIAGN